MYKVTHSYHAEQEHILSLTAGETVCVLEKKNDNWWLAANGQGGVGYAPKNYLKKENENSSNAVLQSVNNAIEEILASAGAAGPNANQQATLKKLLSHKESLMAESKKSRQSSSKRRAPPPPPPDRQTAELSEPVVHKEKEPPAVPQRANSLATSQKSTAIKPSELETSEPVLQSTSPPSREDVTDSTLQSRAEPEKHNVPDELGPEMMNIIKSSFNTNDSKSRAIAAKLLHTMREHLPSLQTVFDDILSTLPEEEEDDESSKLGLALENLREIKNDAQQRNWAIEDDEEKIMAILNEILSELTTIDKQASIKAICYDHNLPIQTLVEYHQMETRIGLRLAVLQIFGVICSLSKSFVSAFLNTVLPLELAMDITTHIQDNQRICYSALVMTMLFSTAEPIPVGHYGRLNKNFIQFLIQYIEGEIEDVETDEQATDMFINILLSFNLHMLIPTENMIMEAISERGTCTTLSEKLMMLLNRGDDPVAMEEHWSDGDEGRPPPSVLKFLQDIFSQKNTSSFLYTNDMNVLIDILTRNLTDLPSGNKLRTDYLDLLLNILTNTNYAESRHRAVDIAQSLNRILQEEQPDTDMERQTLDFDKRIIDNIMQNYGHLFS